MLMTTKGEAAKKPTVSSDFESLKGCVVCSSRFETPIKTRLNLVVPFPNLSKEWLLEKIIDANQNTPSDSKRNI